MYFVLVTLNDYGYEMEKLKLSLDETFRIQQDIRMIEFRSQDGTAHELSVQAGRRHLITIFDSVLLRGVDGQKIRQMCHYIYAYIRSNQHRPAISQLGCPHLDCRFIDIFRMFRSGGENIDAVYLRGPYWDC